MPKNNFIKKYNVQISLLVISLISVIICLMLLSIFTFKYFNVLSNLVNNNQDLINRSKQINEMINSYHEKYDLIKRQAKNTAFCSMFKGVHKKICN